MSSWSQKIGMGVRNKEIGFKETKERLHSGRNNQMHRYWVRDGGQGGCSPEGDGGVVMDHKRAEVNAPQLGEKAKVM